MRLQSQAATLTIGVWCLATIVLANTYAATLLSFLSVAKLEPIPNSLDTLVISGKYQLITQSHTRWVDYLMVFYFNSSMHFN